MREILFRGQTRRKGQKVWMDGSPVDSNWVEGYGVCMGKGDFSVIYAGDHVEKFPVYTDTVGQFTGLTDKNGKKIFEGDIIRSHTKRVLVVAFGQHFDEEYGTQAYGWFVSDSEGSLSLGEDWGGHEVIGNIHDNPELLGGAEND
jgi:uncharacterized phage protein (TIGR01671 family)